MKPVCENPLQAAPAEPERSAGTGQVLFIGNFLSQSAASRGVCEELSQRLAERGWNVLSASRVRNRLFRLIHMSAAAWFWRRRYDVVHVDLYSGLSFLWAEVTCWTIRRAGRPYVLTLHGGNLPVFASRWPTRVARLLGEASAVTAPSGFQVSAMGDYRPDILLIPNAVNLSYYEFRPRCKARPSLIWIRAFHEIYNPRMAVRVLALLRQYEPDCELTMIGPDKKDGSLGRARALAEELGVVDSVKFVAGVPKRDVPLWLNRGDVFLNTADIDNTPVTVIEAMACGLCVVSTDVGGMPFLIRSGENGILTPPNQPEAMTASVLRILRDGDLSERLSRQGRAKAAECDWSVILPRWEALLASVAGTAR
jgi:glycosyltransferase involved in cell wall biosynthesis